MITVALRRVLAVVATLFLLAAPATPAGAHGGAYDMKYVDGANVLLLTFNTHTPVSGLDIEHDLRLYDLLGAPITYDEVVIELHTREAGRSTTLRGSTMVLDDTAPMLPTNESKLTFSYPLRGTYSLLVVFRAGGRDISRGEFAVDVGQGTSAPGGFPWVRLALALLVGVLVGAILAGRAGAPVDAGQDADDEVDDRQDAAGDTESLRVRELSGTP